MTGIELDRIGIRTPCPQSWDEMQGDERTRFCGACGLHVHNLSALRRAEGEALLAARASGGARLCVTYARRADGTIATADDAPAPAPRRSLVRRAASLAASLLGALPFLSALPGCGPAAAGPEAAPSAPGVPATPSPSDPDAPRLTGEIALPEPVLELGKVAVEQGDVALPPPVEK